jgi:hypothetical protein
MLVGMMEVDQKQQLHGLVERAVMGTTRALMVAATVVSVALFLPGSDVNSGLIISIKNHHHELGYGGNIARVAAQQQFGPTPPAGSGSGGRSNSTVTPGCRGVLGKLNQCLPYIVLNNTGSRGNQPPMGKNKSSPGCCNPLVGLLKSPFSNNTQCLCSLVSLGSASNVSVDVNKTMLALLSLCNYTRRAVP